MSVSSNSLAHLPLPQVPMAAAQDDPQQDDARLLQRVVQGDRQAFAVLVRRHQRTVFHIAWRYLNDDEDARDVTQAAFVRAWQNCASFRGESSFRTWLVQIAIHLALNYRRDRGRRRQDPLDDDKGALPDPHALHPTDRIAHAETAEQLRQAVSTLPAKQRLVVELRVHEGLSFKEVAEIAECSEDSAKANFHYALKRLRSLLAPAPQAIREVPQAKPEP